MKRFFFIVAVWMVGTGWCAFAMSQTSVWPWVQSIGLVGETSPALQVFISQSLGKGVSSEFVREVLVEGRTLRAQQLPTEAYFLKVSEGLAKGVRPAQMAHALGQTRQRTEVAGHLVDQAIARGTPLSSPQERFRAIRNFEGALLSGIPQGALEQMVKAKERGPAKNSFNEWEQELGQLRLSLPHEVPMEKEPKLHKKNPVGAESFSPPGGSVEQTKGKNKNKNNVKNKVFNKTSSSKILNDKNRGSAPGHGNGKAK